MFNPVKYFLHHRIIGGSTRVTIINILRLGKVSVSNVRKGKIDTRKYRLYISNSNSFFLGMHEHHQLIRLFTYLLHIYLTTEV